MTQHPTGVGHVVEQVLAGLGTGLHGVVLAVLVLVRVAFAIGLAKLVGVVVLVVLVTRPVWRRVRARRAGRIVR